MGEGFRGWCLGSESEETGGESEGETQQGLETGLRMGWSLSPSHSLTLPACLPHN